MLINYTLQPEVLKNRIERRNSIFSQHLIGLIRDHFANVQSYGDSFIRSLTETYDGTIVEDLVLSEEYVSKCVADVSDELRAAIMQAHNNATEVNKLFMPSMEWDSEVRPGAFVGERIRPLDQVCLWVPARKGPLLSTAIMLVTSAKVAGVRHIVVALPPSISGIPDPSTVAAARICGAHQIVCGNGVGIIAGCTFGTNSLPKVNAILGPGPGGIAAAMAVSFSYGCKTVMGIGPTDSAIYWDGTTPVMQMALDFINESEHGNDSISLLVTQNAEKAEELYKEILRILDSGEVSRSHIVKQTLSTEGMSSVVVCESLEDCIDILNDFAAEHMMVRCSDDRHALAVIDRIQNCGEILWGAFTPFSAANYAIGITAVLPTNGFSKNISGITCRDMLKSTTIGKLTKEGLGDIRKTISVFSKHEELPFHGLAAEGRFVI